jgi:hypothetical protein
MQKTLNKKTEKEKKRGKKTDDGEQEKKNLGAVVQDEHSFE